MRTFLIVVLGALLGYFFAEGVKSAFSQEHHPSIKGHAEFHDVYKEWMQPYPLETLGCCNAKYHPETNEEVGGDCFPTNAWMIDKTWYAYNDFTGDVVAVPDNKIIRQFNPDSTGSRAHLCWSVNGNGVLCFVPPFGGF